MKLAFVIQKIAQRSGGAERVLIEAANELAKRGHQVTILSHENRGVPPFYELGEGVGHTNLFDRPIEGKAKERWKRREKFREKLPLFFPVNHLKWHMTHGGFVKELKKYIDRERPDVLIPFLPAAITPTALAAHGKNVKVVASTHNEPSQDFDNPARWDRNPIDLRLRHQVLTDIDKILVLLPAYREYYPKALHHKIDDMPNPVRPVNSELLASAQREKLILGVGRLAGVKRFKLLIETWSEIARFLPQWRVEIYGDGPDKGKLQALINTYGLEKSISLMGVTPAISEQYLKASILCHPAEHEGFPLAVCEALAHGLPVVGFSDCSGLNSLVVNEKTGILVNPGTDRMNSLQSALIELLPDQSRLSRFSAAAPASVAQYSPAIVYDKWEQTICDLVEPEDSNNHYW